MVSDLNMSHVKISDFVSFPLFGFILVIKLRTFNFESHWNTLIFFDEKRYGVRFDALFKNVWFRSWDQANLVLNSTEKVKPGFLLSLMSMFPESNGTKFWAHSFHLQNSGILQTKMDQTGDFMKKQKDFLITEMNTTNN